MVSRGEAEQISRRLRVTPATRSCCPRRATALPSCADGTRGDLAFTTLRFRSPWGTLVQPSTNPLWKQKAGHRSVP